VQQYCKHSPGIGSVHIWTQCKELKVRCDRHAAETAALVQEVDKIVSSNSHKWIIDTGTLSHMTPDRNWFESFSLVCSNVVLATKIQVEYTGIGLVRLC
jgi:hypothetical protein